MGRYTVTLVFDVGPGAVPPGPDVLERVPLPDGAVQRLSSTDGTALTVVVDFRSSHPASVCRRVCDAIRAACADTDGADPGEPRRVRVRPLRPPQPAPAGPGRAREYVWRPSDGGDGTLVLVDAGSDPYSRPNAPPQTRAPEHAPQHRVRGLGPLRIALPTLPRRHRD